MDARDELIESTVFLLRLFEYRTAVSACNCRVRHSQWREIELTL